jgi:hypothetical protein
MKKGKSNRNRQIADVKIMATQSRRRNKPPSGDYVSGFKKAVETVSKAASSAYNAKRITPKRQNERNKQNKKQTPSIVKKLGLSTNSMSSDFVNWAKGFANPFSTTEISLPHVPLMKHQCICNKQSGKFSTNANGNGFISVVPAYCVANNLNQAITVSNGATSDNIEPPGSGVQFVMNSPYAFNDFNLGTQSGYQYRIAALGVRIRYIGTVVNGGGTCVGAELLPKSNTGGGFGGYTYANLKSNPAYKEYPMATSEWRAITRQFSSMKDLDYVGFNLVTSAFTYAELDGAAPPQTLDSIPNICMFVNGPANNQYEFEVWAHFEIVGSGLPSQVMTTDSSENVKKVNSALQNVRNIDNDTADHSVAKESGAGISTTGKPSTFGKVVSTVTDMVSDLVPISEILTSLW